MFIVITKLIKLIMYIIQTKIKLHERKAMSTLTDINNPLSNITMLNRDSSHGYQLFPKHGKL